MEMEREREREIQENSRVFPVFFEFVLCVLGETNRQTNNC
jgi:hypothetical protein